MKQQINPPENWDDFEQLTQWIWAVKWRDPDAARNGRKGQKQRGVDVYGRPDQGVNYEGVQCKKRDLGVNSPLTEKEIRHEVEEAEKFTPKLQKLTIATTLNRDQAAQAIERKINGERLKAKKFPIIIFFWDDFKDFLYDPDNSDIYAKYEGRGIDNGAAQSPPTDQIDGLNARRISQQTTQLAGPVGIVPLTNSQDTTDGLHDEYESQMDHIKSLMAKHDATQALKLATDLFTRMEEKKASSEDKFKALTHAAIANVWLGETAAAARLYIRAEKLMPESNKAKINAAFGYYLIEDTDKARAFVKQVLDADPLNPRAWALDVDLSSPWLSYEQTLAAIPKSLHTDTHIAFLLGRKATNEELFDEAVKWLEQSLEGEADDQVECKLALAQTLLLRVQAQNPRATGGQTDTQGRADTERSIQLLTDAWSALDDDKVKLARKEILLNRSVGYRFLGRDGESKADLDAIKLLGANSHELIRQLALFEMEQGSFAQALELLVEALDIGISPESIGLLAEVLRASGRPDQAVDVIQTSFSSNELLLEDPPILSTYFESLLQADKVEDAQKLATSLAKSAPESFWPLYLQASLARNSKDQELTRSLLLSAAEAAPSDEELILVADELYGMESFSEAATVYSKLPSITSLADLARKLLYSYYMTNNTVDGLNLLERMSGNQPSDPMWIQIAGALHERAGNLKAASDLYIGYLETTENADIRVSLATVQFRGGDYEKVDEYLATKPSIKSLSAISAIQLSNLYFERGFYDDAITSAYVTRRNHFSSHDAQMNFIAQVMKADGKTKLLGEQDVAAVNSAVTIESALGTKTYILVDSDAKLEQQELDNKHSVYAEILGKKVGDEVSLAPKAIPPVVGKITEIIDKYSYTTRVALSEYQTLFPDGDGIVSMKLGGEDVAPEDAVAPLMSLLDDQKSRGASSEQLYRDHRITLGMFAKMIGKSYFNVLEGLADASTPGIVTSLLTFDPDRAEHYLEPDAVLVVDTSAIYSLAESGLGDLLLKAGCKFVSTQSTLDEFGAAVSEAKGQQAKGYGMMVKVGEKFTMIDISAEQVALRAAKYGHILSWARKNVEVRALSGEALLSTDSPLADALGVPAAETIAAASVITHSVLITDDGHLAEVARSMGQLASGSTIDLLHARFLGETEASGREDLTTKLAWYISNNYQNIPFTVAVLEAAASASDWKPSAEPIATVVNLLTPLNLDPDNLGLVITGFLFQVWRRPLLPQTRSFFLQLVLSKIPLANRKIVIHAMNKYLPVRFVLMPIALQEIRQEIQAWQVLRDEYQTK